jgi:7,8-dihydropterin-6-yl-methyl-4-(beta-D-ribofuranosyl)aminobenzene 5'-phosphate synthase
MEIVTLIENTSEFDTLMPEHGLSLYIETDRHRILFDTGSSPQFAVNALKLGVDLASVDMAILSHGHYDHGGGLATFLDLNKSAAVYVSANAFQKHYAHSILQQQKYIGLDQTLSGHPRLVSVEGNLKIDDQLEIMSRIEGARFIPSGNQDMYAELDGALSQDDFFHEQNLIVCEQGKTLLVAGCAHRGIMNIVDQYIVDKGQPPDAIIGGFHLHNRASNRDETEAVVAEIGKALAETKARCCTGHCTGLKSFTTLKEIMGDQLAYLATGTRIII